MELEELIRYCFGYSAADIENDVRLNGRSTILDKILSEKKAGDFEKNVRLRHRTMT